MKIILNQDVEKLGKTGQVADVKDGFARNFLIPQGLAVPLTPVNLKKLEQDKLRKGAQLEKIKKDAQQLKERLTGLSLTIPALTHDDEKLYGGITSSDISDLLKEEGFTIDKDCIMLEEPMRALGIYEVPVRLHPEVSANIKVWVVKK